MIALLENGLCNPSSADGGFFPPQLIQDFDIQLTTCIHCGPGLYWQPRLSTTPISSQHSSQVTAHNKE